MSATAFVAVVVAFVALFAAAVADAAAATASTNNAQWFVSVSASPTAESATHIYMLLSCAVVVAFTMSRCTKAAVVVVALLPLNVPSSCATLISPELSNASILDARSVALVVNSVLVIVFVRESLIERSSSSSCC